MTFEDWWQTTNFNNESDYKIIALAAWEACEEQLNSPTNLKDEVLRISKENYGFLSDFAKEMPDSFYKKN